MDALISAFVEDIKQRAALYNEDSEGNLFNDNSANEADGEQDFLNMLLKGIIKGTVSRDFQPWGFFINKSHFGH
jgi:hypothetical protein